MFHLLQELFSLAAAIDRYAIEHCPYVMRRQRTKRRKEFRRSIKIEWFT